MKNQKRLEELQIAELLESMFPSGPSLSTDYFLQPSWSLSEFCVLANRTRPEDLTKASEGEFSDIEIDRVDEARNLHKKFTKHIKQIAIHEGVHLENGELRMSPWKFIKWCSIKRISLPDVCWKSFPHALLEIHLEFNPLFSPLRTHTPNRREYHLALYLKTALQIRLRYGIESYDAIHDHPQMENTLRTIRRNRGKYERDTYITSWLPKLWHRKRGRPKKRAHLS